MKSDRIRDTRLKILTPQEEEERRVANKEFFNGDITQKYFDDRNDIQSFIFSLCREKGFTPCSQLKKTGDFLQYFCEFSGFPSKTSRFSKKTGCMFYINISRTNKGFHVSSMDGRHNHPIVNNDLCMNKATEDEILILHSTGLSPRHISKVLETKGICLPTNLINGIAYKNKIRNIDEDSEQLSNYMKSIGGEFIPFDYTNDLQNTPLRCAIWTQNNSEKNNISRFGDIILFDSTESNLVNGWLSIPVSVIDSNRHILPAGLCFVAFETEEVLTFLCKHIFSDESIRELNKVIITDEDQSYKSVIARLLHQPKHILCALHKLKNFNRNLKSSDLTKEEKNQAKQHFSTICFSKNKQTVEKCFKSLFLLNDSSFVSYCRKLYAEKKLFCKAFIVEFTAGYNTSSIAESMNNLIKIDSNGRKLTLLEFRKQFDYANQRASRNAEFKNSKKQYPVNFPFTGIIDHVSKSCVCEIYNNIQKSTKYSSIQCGTNKFEVKHNKTFEENNIVEVGNIVSCTCNQYIQYGYPCPHIINVLLTFHPNIQCINLIHKHWIVGNNNNMNFAINENAFQSLINTVNTSFNDEIANELSIDINIDSPKRYLKFMYYSKQLARIASLASDEMYKQMFYDLSALLSIYSAPVNAINSIMAEPSKKGRKKIKKMLEEKESGKPDLCKICRQQHKFQECSIFNYYIYRVKNPTGDKNLRKCSLCNSHGHNYATCDVKIGGKLGITDQMIMSFYGKTQPPDIRKLIDSLKINEMI